MASYFDLTLDTTGPAGVTASINSGDGITTAQDASLAIGTSDSTTGYQMKVWGAVDPAADANIQTTEGASAWVAYSSTQAVRLSTGDGSKTLSVKIRDDVYNESSTATDSISLDTTTPGVAISTGPDVSKISKMTGKRTASFSFTSDVEYDEYKVKVVPATSSLNTAGTPIPTTNGSTNMSGATGAYPATTPTACAIDGRDLDLADSGDGVKVVKVFVKATSNGVWSA